MTHTLLIAALAALLMLSAFGRELRWAFAEDVAWCVLLLGMFFTFIHLYASLFTHGVALWWRLFTGGG